MKIIWLSHILEPAIPLYAGATDLRFAMSRSISQGDSCNTTIISLPSHAGTHVDVPYHFLADGSTVDMYPPETWIFTSPRIAELAVKPGQLIGPDELPRELLGEKTVDLLLLKTGFEKKRQEEIYWKEGPGLAASLAGHLKECYPDLRAVGVDFLSISSLTNREEGRSAHRSFLEQGILIFEDLSLYCLNQGERLPMVIALPLRFTGGDGAPCSILGWTEEQ